jgi:hypothetical protein
LPSSKSRPNPNQRPRQDPNAIWEDRTALVKRELEAERRAVDAKTARLRALRLEKEAADKAAEPPQAIAKASARKRTSTIKA